PPAWRAEDPLPDHLAPPPSKPARHDMTRLRVPGSSTTLARAGAVACVAIFAWGAAPASTPLVPADAATEIAANDNRRPGGRRRAGVLTVALVAGAGTWHPEAAAGPGHAVYAFGEAGKGLQNPGPLLRVPAGTEILLTIRNTIPGESLLVHGLHDRPGS